MSGMDDVVTLTLGDRLALADDLAAANGTVYLAVDPIDGGVKLKIGGRWGVHYGSMPQQRDPSRNVADDMREEARAIVPVWYERGVDRPGRGDL